MNWEYKVKRFQKRRFFGGNLDEQQIAEQINSYGSIGWELVSCEVQSSFIGIELSALAIFKRPKES